MRTTRNSTTPTGTTSTLTIPNGGGSPPASPDPASLGAGLQRRGKRREAGFSLIEIMVVLAIIATLVGATTMIIGVANRASAKQMTNKRLFALGAALDQLKSNDNLGAYPPTRTLTLHNGGVKPEQIGQKIGQGNETNVGIESAYIAVNLNFSLNLSGLEDGGALSNTDDDKIEELVGTLNVHDRFEYVDGWGNPFVYIHSKDYGDMKGVEQYMLGDQERTTVKVKPRVEEKTGKPFRANKFQLFSMGPDNEPNTEDDIHYE